jgi:hypothetical protein
MKFEYRVIDDAKQKQFIRWKPRPRQYWKRNPNFGLLDRHGVRGACARVIVRLVNSGQMKCDS